MDATPFRGPHAQRWRLLTEGEIAIASLLFRGAVDYSRVRIHRRRYMPFQPKNCAMTPNGSMYFHHSCFLDDYAAGDIHAQHWFMHEMVHVWQHQLGYPVRLRGAVRLGLSYEYLLRAGATLADFNMEAQGDLLADYFVLKHRDAPKAMRWRRNAASLALFEEVLDGFLVDPANRSHLPRTLARRFGGTPAA
jgi:hypothetical protein